MAKRKKLTINDFIEKSNIIHNNKYDYSVSIYTNSKTKISIICPSHGLFYQAPSNHLSGQGCSLCAGNILKTNEDFIKQASIIHNNKYEYIDLYVSAHTLLNIKCLIHGFFKQKPNNHLNGQGCLLCAILAKTKFHESFVAEASIVHNDKYEYMLSKLLI